MGAVQAMIGPLIPPVYNEVSLAVWDEERASDCWNQFYPSYTPVFFNSGTEALAIAVSISLAGLNGPDRNVFIPAYGCPDLVAATLAAEGNPVLVDIMPDCWGYDLEDLERKVSGTSGTVLAVNLLGLGDQVSELELFATKHNLGLIQDSAQFVGRSEDRSYCAPLVVWSFGRGKPINLLFGGALLVRKDVNFSSFSSEKLGVRGYNRLPSLAKGALFNSLFGPHSYAFLKSMSLFGIGETAFKPCPVTSEIFRLPFDFIERVVPALSRRFEEKRVVARLIADLIVGRKFSGVKFPNATGEESADLLRFPVLFDDKEARTRFASTLQTFGVSSSTMYAEPLPRIASMPDSIKKQGPFPGAQSYADALLTLPVHKWVSRQHIEIIESCLKSLKP